MNILTWVIWGPSLGRKHPIAVGFLWNVQVAKFNESLILWKENIGALDIPVVNVHIVQHFQALYDLQKILPNQLLFHVLFATLELLNPLLEVASCRVLHHNA